MADSVTEFWARFKAVHPQAPEVPAAAFHFCDNQEDADACAELVVQGKKRATASSVAELELSGDPIPEVGDLNVVTDFRGHARAVIKTTSVDIMAFGEVDGAFASEEGEGDLSLEWWREAHLAYYGRVLKGADVIVDHGLSVVCERFKLVFTG